MGDHIAETASEDHKYGEDFWSAEEEFCSCHSEEEEEEEEEDGNRGKIEFCTCNDDGDDGEYEYFCDCHDCSPLDLKRYDESEAYMKKAETQYDLQHSKGSTDEKLGEDKRQRKQLTSENNVSNLEPEWNYQSTGNHAIKDRINSDKSKHVQGGVCKKDRKSGSLENTNRSNTPENKAGERIRRVSTKRIGLVHGNRPLTSVAGSTVSSMIEGEDQTEFPNQQKERSTAKSKYHCKMADKKHRTHQVHAQHAPKQTGQIARDERDFQPFSYIDQKPIKNADTKGQENSLDNGKQNGVPESSRDQSSANAFSRKKILQNDLLIKQLQDDDENARVNVDSSSPCQIKDETEDLMIIVLSTVPDVSDSIEGPDTKMDTSFATKTSFSIQENDYFNTHEGGSKGDKRRNQTPNKTTQKSQKRFAEEVSQRPTPNADTMGKNEVLYNEDHICSHCLKHLREYPCDRRGGKMSTEEEILQRYLSSNHFVKQAKQDKLDDSEESCKPFQRNNNDDKITSKQFSVPALSHLVAGKERAEVDATYTTNDSISIRVNKLDKEHNVNTEAKEMLSDNRKQNYFHPYEPSCERREDVTENHLQRRRQNEDVKEKEELHDDGKQDVVPSFEYLNESCDQSDGKNFPREDLRQNYILTNQERIDANGGQHLKWTKQYLLGKQNKSSESCKPSQKNDEIDDQIPSIQSPNPQLSCPTSHLGIAETDSPITSKSSIVIPGDERAKQHYYYETQKPSNEEREKLLDDRNHEYVLCLKCQHESSFYQNGRKNHSSEEIINDNLHPRHARNGNQNGSYCVAETKYNTQGNNGTIDVIPSIRSPVQELSASTMGRYRAEMDTSSTANDSISSRVNGFHQENHYGSDGNSFANEKLTCVHSVKYPQAPSCERSDGKVFQRKNSPDNDLPTIQSKNDDKIPRQRFKGNNENSKGKLNDGKKLPSRHIQSRSPKADSKGTEKLLDSGKQDYTQYSRESSCDLSGSNSFERDEDPKNDQPNNHLRNDDAKRSQPEKQDHIPCLEYPRESVSDRSGSNSFQRDEIAKNDQINNQLRNDDVNRSQPLKGPIQNSNATLIYHQRHSRPKSDIIYANGSILAPLNDPPTNLRNCDEGSTSPLIRTSQFLKGKVDDEAQTLNHERRTPKADVSHPQVSSCASHNDLSTYSRDDEEISTPPLIRTNEKYRGKLDDTNESRDQCQEENETGMVRSVRSSSQETSDAKSGMDRTKIDPTGATNASISIRGNMVLSSTGSHKKYFYDMWMKGKFCDVNIVVDSHTFLAHRVVLAANSEYFDKFFLKSPARTDDTDLLTVYVIDMSADIFRVILSYMYTGHIDIQFSQVSQLLRGSLFLLIKSLASALQDFLLNTWKGECIGAFCLAQTAGLHDLHREILNYIRTHFVEVSTSEHFALCPVEYASSILSDDNLRINEETDVLYAILLWLEHHTRDISSNLRLLRHVRFEYIPLATIDRIEKGHLKSIANESVKRYIQDARKRASFLEVDELHFDPPIIRQRIAEVVGCRTVRTKDSQSSESMKSDRSFKTSKTVDRISPLKEEQISSHSQDNGLVSPGHSTSYNEERICPSKEEAISSHSQQNGLVSPGQTTSNNGERICPSKEEVISSHSQHNTLHSRGQKSSSSSKSCHSDIIKAGSFPSYHEIDTTPIRVSVSQDDSTSPAVSNDNLGERSCQESAEDELSVQVVRIGGISRTWKEDCVHNDIEKLENGRGKRWEEWTSFAELPVAVHHHAACYIHNSIYISGGHVQLPCDARSNHFQPSRLFHVYDLLKARWYRLKDLEQARVFHQMVALFGQIYVIGGQGHDGGALSAVERYSPYTDTWRQAAPLSFARYATAAAVYNFHLWVAGGATNHVTSQNADDSLQQSGEESGTSVYDGFYRSASTFLTGVVECYSPHNNSWTKINDLPTPRCHASLHRINKRLFLVGGFCSIRRFPTDDSSTSSVDVYDDVTESWCYVTDVGEGNYGANTVGVGSKIVILGKPGPLLESDGDIISIFDTSTNNWELRRSLLLEARVGHACCAIPVSLHSTLRQT